MPTNGLSIKIHGGTRSAGDKTLCATCQHCHCIKGAAESQVIYLCDFMNGSDKVPFDVSECTKYYRRGQTSLYDLRQTAWILESDRVRQSVGFIPYSKWKKRHQEEKVMPGMPDEEY